MSTTNLSQKLDGSGGGSQNTNKNYSRSSRRRESPTSGNANTSSKRPEATTCPRKPTPQKSKSMDKRPRPRPFNNSLRSVEEDGTQRTDPEMGSLQTPGSKKQNFNHLLNFHFAPRDNRQTTSWRSHHSSGTTSFRPKFNKESFLQANCQFLVKSTGDYSAHTYNPDLLVDWDMIEQIYIRVVGEFPQCPICLGPPVAAKITRCGHIFCWPCLLHYLALSDKKYRKCPICYEQVYKHELKSVVATLCEDVHVGEEIEMQLMFRKKGCFKAKPVMCEAQLTFDWESVFGKLLVATPAEVKNLLDREAVELRQRYEEDEHCPEICFVEQAIRELDTRRSNMVTLDSKEDTNNQDLAKVLAAIHPAQDWLTSESTPTSPDTILSPTSQFLEVTQELTSKIVTRSDSIGNESAGVENSSDGDASPTKAKDDCFYFYQAVQGQNIYLHPLNMAILWKAFGPEPTNLPQVIQFRVVEVESCSMVEDMRKRLKFLQHLPITTSVQLVEVDLTTSCQHVLAEFHQQLESRRKRRVQRARDERIRERLREEEERKKMLYPPCPKFEPKLDFPEYHYEDYETPIPTLNVASNDDGSMHISTTDGYTGFNEATLDSDQQKAGAYSVSPSGMSFSQIVSQKSTITPPSSGRREGAWGLSVSPQARSHKNSDSDAGQEEYTSVPAYRMSMSDAIAKAIANVSITEETELEQASQNNGNGKKKGRKKGKVLFATGIEKRQVTLKFLSEPLDYPKHGRVWSNIYMKTIET